MFDITAVLQSMQSLLVLIFIQRYDFLYNVESLLIVVLLFCGILVLIFPCVALCISLSYSISTKIELRLYFCKNMDSALNFRCILISIYFYFVYTLTAFNITEHSFNRLKTKISQI